MADPISSSTVNLQIMQANGTWLSLNDHVNYAIAANNTRDAVTTQYNRIEATSPVLDGSYVVHVSRGMTQETVSIYIYGTTQAIVQSNYRTLLAAMEQWAFQLQWTWADYSETWNCSAVTQASMDMSQVMVHAYMATATFQIPRFPALASHT